MAVNNSAEIGFEKEIWDAACILRGNMDAGEYKHVILGLIFLKYISDAFDKRYHELVSEGEEEDRDAYTEKNIFFVPPTARWPHIAAKTHTPEIGKAIDEAMDAIEKENKRLKGVLPKTFARPEMDKRRLGQVVDLFTNISVAANGGKMDVLGRTYEYCLGKFAEQEGKLAGEFFTPSSVVRTLVEVIKPFKGRVYDPCCGSGGMFVQSARFVEEHSGTRDKDNLSIYGQDSNPTTWKLCKMNLAIRGIEADLGKAAADTFFNDVHPTTKADYVLANPPFNLSGWGADKLADDKRWKYGTPPAGNANFAWMQHMIHHMSAKGRMGMVLANGSLTSQDGGEGEIRQKIVEEDLVEGIIAMPPKLFFTTSIQVSLWFLNKAKNKKQIGKTLFVDARHMGTMVSRRLREMTDGDISKVVAMFDAFESGKLVDEAGFCKVATIKEIAKRDYILTPGRYVGLVEQNGDIEPFEEKMERLTAELSTLFTNGRRLESMIDKQLKALDYEI